MQSVIKILQKTGNLFGNVLHCLGKVTVVWPRMTRDVLFVYLSWDIYVFPVALIICPI